MKIAWLLDFDGTVSPTDIGAGLIGRFARGNEVEAHEALEGWKSGRLGHRELTERECRRLVVRHEEALEYARAHSIDPEFAPFARAEMARGNAVLVVSEGFDFYIAELLDRAGLGAVPRAANHARFEGESLIPEFPHFDPACPRCGNCKGRHVRLHQARGHRVVFVGDGLSDRCGAAAADVVFARADLLEWCVRERVPAHPFPGFAGLSAALAA
jgi:2,3-diketo-5-methylthio-1-phosphopentane phosphatase